MYFANSAQNSVYEFLIYLVKEFRPYAILIIILLLISCMALLIENRSKVKKIESERNFNIGEEYVKKELQKAIENEEDYFSVNNIQFYNYGEGYNTQIDHVLITPQGIFAIETKYWKGLTYVVNVNVSEMDKSFVQGEIYRNKLLINIDEDGRANLYRPRKKDNVMVQTVKHAANLKKQLFGYKSAYVKGILLFVTNDNCHLALEGQQYIDDTIAIMSLSELVSMIKNKELYRISNYHINSDEINELYMKISKLSKEP